VFGQGNGDIRKKKELTTRMGKPPLPKRGGSREHRPAQ
jgi:hypothetical protein